MNYTTNNGGSAFPVYDHHADGQQFLAETGINMRDYFAAKAMQGLLAKGEADEIIRESDMCWTDAIAGDSYAMADAMLKARGQK